MRRQWLLMVWCVFALAIHARKASATYPGFPNFPTLNDRIATNGNFNPVDDDIIDDIYPAPIQVTHMRVRSEIALRYARTAIISNVYNPSRKSQQASFNVLLPDTAFISGFTMTLGKETYDAYVKEKDEAKQIYNNAVSQGISAAHVATKARDSNHFTIKFNLEGRSNATYRLRYEEFLVRRNGVYNHAINLHPGALVPKMDVVVHIKESQKISKLRVPELRSGNEIDATEYDAKNTKAVIRRGKNEREATIIFIPDLAEQKRLAEIYAEKSKQSSVDDYSHIGYESAEETDKEGLLGQFVIQYDVDQPKNGEILVNDGYFVHFFAPSSLPPLSKHAVFALDTSGSMAGTKIEQLRIAMNAILSDLNPNDYFSIIEFKFDVQVHDLKEADEYSDHSRSDNSFYNPPSYKPINIVPPAIASAENIAKAKIIVSRLDAYGGTNIYDALDVALNIIQNGFDQHAETDSVNNQTELVAYVNGTDKTKVLEPVLVFLSDGEPTEGVIDTNRIVNYISERNSAEKQTPLFSLAFGDDADRVFLRKLSLRNEGFMRQIYEASDAALQLHDFYRQVSSPLLSNVKFLYPGRQIKEGSVSRSQFRTINDGSEVAVVGRVVENVNEITPQILGLRGDGDGRSRKRYEINPRVSVPRSKDEYLPLERLWAYLTIKQLLDKRDASDISSIDEITSDTPEKKALDLALKFEFVTPLTSLVVVRLNKTDVVGDVEAVHAESVDEPRFLPYKLQSSSLSSPRPVYTALSTTGGLTLESDAGPVLFVESTKRLQAGAVSYGQSSHSSSGSYSSGFQASVGVSTGQAQVVSQQSHSVSQQSHSVSQQSHSEGVSYGSSQGTQDYGQVQSNFTVFGQPTVTTNNSLINLGYQLEGYEWTLSVLNQSLDALVIWKNGSQITLKLSTVGTPKSFPSDLTCSSYATGSTYSGLDNVESVCVYITRCDLARQLTVDDYQRDYCYINYWYAGVCCPKNEIDKKVNGTATVT